MTERILDNMIRRYGFHDWRVIAFAAIVDKVAQKNK